MRKKATLRIYLNDKCNLRCEYCNVNYDIKTTITEKDFFDFVEKNREDINFNLIYVFGGEPLVAYTDELYNFLNKNFNKVLITTNFTMHDRIKKIIELLNGKVNFAVSFNSLHDKNRNNIEEIIKNIEEFKSYISEFNLLLNEETYLELYETVKFLNKFGKMIFVLPETKKDGSEFLFDEKILKEQLEKIFAENLHHKMFDYAKQKEIDNSKKNTYDNCNGSTILISKTGEMFACEYISNIYRYSDTVISLGNIKNTLIKDIDFENKKCIYPVIGPNNEKCLEECGKCYHIECNPKYYTNNNYKMPSQLCQYSKVFYDFAHDYAEPLNLEEVTIFLTESCNMRCKYCFEGEYKNQLGKVSNEIIEKAIDLLVQVDGENLRKKLGFFGGEPTLNIEGMEHALDYYLKLKKEGLKCNMIFDINTNMLKLNDEIIRVFRRFQEEANLYISVSLDGCKEDNDINRVDVNGKGTYDRIIENVKELKKKLIICKYSKKCKNIIICKHSVLTSNNIKYLRETCEETWRLRNVFDEFSITYATVGKGEEDYYILSNENLRYVQKIYKEIQEIKDEEKRTFLTNHFRDLNVIIENLLTNQHSICNAVDKLLAIRANGDILPCHAFLDKIYEDDYENEYKIGNILDIKGKFGIKIFNKNYKYINKEEKINNHEYKMVSELGFDCNKCEFKQMCHICFASLKSFKNNTIVKRKEMCMRTLRQAKILMELQQESLDKDIKEYENLMNKNIDGIVEGLTELAKKTEQNNNEINNIKGFLDDLTEILGDENNGNI